MVREDLSKAPPIDDRRARLAWAGTEADMLLALIARNRHDALSWTLLAALAVVVTSDLESALAVTDLDSAKGFRELLTKIPSDTKDYLEILARHGAGGGYFALAVMELHGIAAARNAEAACALFSKAWDAGFQLSAYRLSQCVAGSDRARSAALLRTAAGLGHAAAREQIGRDCLESRPPDVPCAVREVEAAAIAGRPSAISLLGWMSAQGVGMKIDIIRARSLYREAAAAGDLSAKNNLGELYETGRGVEVDPGRAAAYYREAAEAGFAAAKFNLGRLYAAGTGVARDPEEARKWLRAALQAGIQPAQKVLDWLGSQPAPVSR